MFLKENALGVITNGFWDQLSYLCQLLVRIGSISVPIHLDHVLYSIHKNSEAGKKWRKIKFKPKIYKQPSWDIVVDIFHGPN